MNIVFERNLSFFILFSVGQSPIQQICDISHDLVVILHQPIAVYLPEGGFDQTHGTTTGDHFTIEAVTQQLSQILQIGLTANNHVHVVQAIRRTVPELPAANKVIILIFWEIIFSEGGSANRPTGIVGSGAASD